MAKKHCGSGWSLASSSPVIAPSHEPLSFADFLLR
jgi:hypothetical protein